MNVRRLQPGRLIGRGAALYGALLAVSPVLSLAGCDRNGAATPEASPAVLTEAPPARGGATARTVSAALTSERDSLERRLSTPAGTIEQLRGWRAARRYREMEPYIDPPGRIHFIDTLAAMDQVLAANRQAMKAIAELWGEHRVLAWDLSGLGAHLGVFSDEVSLIREDVDGDEATVIYQVGRTVPLNTARLRRIEGRWVYLPGDSTAEFPRAMQRLARTLGEVAEAIYTQRMPPDRIDQEYRLRVVPRLQALHEAGAATDAEE
jgi:hypothetical protein